MSYQDKGSKVRRSDDRVAALDRLAQYLEDHRGWNSDSARLRSVAGHVAALNESDRHEAPVIMTGQRLDFDTIGQANDPRLNKILREMRGDIIKEASSEGREVVAFAGPPMDPMEHPMKPMGDMLKKIKAALPPEIQQRIDESTLLKLVKELLNANPVMASSEDNGLTVEAKKLTYKGRQRMKDSSFACPASHPKVSDGKDHFPISDAAHGRNALARVHQYDKAPGWWKGSLEELQSTVSRKVHSRHKGIDKGEKKESTADFKSRMLKRAEDMGLYD